MNYYFLLEKISNYFGFFIIGLMSFTIFYKKLRIKIKNNLKKFQFLYYGFLFILFVLSGNLSHYFNEKQLFINFNTFKTEFNKIHNINKKYFKTYILNFEQPIRMELMSKIDPEITVFNISFEKYAKETGKALKEVKQRYTNYIKTTNKEIKKGLNKLKENILPIYNIYKLPFQNNNPVAIEVDKDGNIIPVIHDESGKVKNILYYDSNYLLSSFDDYNKKKVLFDFEKNEKNSYFKKIINVYYLEKGNIKVPIDYYKNNIDTNPYYIDLKENKDSFLKSMKVKKEYSSYIAKKLEMKELIKKNEINKFKDFLKKNNLLTLNTIFSDGNPAFTYAVLVKSKNIFNYFLENKFNINLLDKELKSVLHNAIIYEYDIKFLKKLIEKGVNLKTKDIFGKYAIDYAKFGSDIYKYLNSIINK